MISNAVESDIENDVEGDHTCDEFVKKATASVKQAS